MAKRRSIKVYGQSGYKYQETPTIMLKGMWLKELGFEIGDYISVVCEDGKLIITPDTDRAELEKAEAEIMENERIKNKEDYPKNAMYIEREYVDYDYSRNHKNIVISDVLSVIDEVILFKLSNYFLKVSKAYKEIRGKDPDHDWYEFVEYGSTNEDTINIQKHGFSRE